MYDLNSSVLSKSGVSTDQLNNNLLSSLKGLASDFLTLESKYGINAVFAAGHAAEESGWGESEIALTKHNLFGIAAYDSNPGDAMSFVNDAQCIDYYGGFLLKEYLTPGAPYYNGTTVHDVFERYSSSHDREAETIVEIMNQLSAGATSPNPIAIQYSDYTVVRGDTLSQIALRFNTTIAAIMTANPIIRNENIIDIGWVLKIPMSPLPPSTPNTRPSITHTVVRGDTLSQLALTYHTTVDAIMKANPIIKNKNLILTGWVLTIP